ncbi:hypothetical protein DUI87_16739 [Hirundo rustica rustica]|uniref:Uncharacterized protein n=1 Tax=Hirundo rustica rustica TaxID=333673 RepID=A0A3M0K4C8_HIRRU|nr:hypothetical protein DUI87_16739 [Hirundo rustica rustica]
MKKDCDLPENRKLLMSERSHLKCCVQVCGSRYEKDMDPLEQVQRRVMKMVKGLEHLWCGDRLGQLGLFSLEKRSPWVDLRAAFKY